jgi:hypothetical protein
MKWLKRIKWYYCRHCGKKFKDPAMAKICFDLDLKILEYDKPVKKV